MDDIKTVWEGRYITVDLVDTTTECFIQEGVYSLTQMIDLYEELADAFGVTIKELKKLDHNVTYSEEMQEQLEPIFDEEKANKRMDVIGQNGNEGLHYGEVEDEQAREDC